MMVLYERVTYHPADSLFYLRVIFDGKANGRIDPSVTDIGNRW